MNILHLMVSGGIGGIEKLMYDYALKSVHKNFFVFIWAAGEIADAMKNSGCNVIYLNESKNSPIKNFRRILKIWLFSLPARCMPLIFPSICRYTLL